MAVIAVVLNLLLISARPALGQRPLGVDVYTGNGTITWSSVYNAGYSFAWAKATEGVGYQDSQFVANAQNAQAAGVLLGAYHYARYDLNLGLTGATNEANWFWSVAGPYIKANGGYLVPFLDVEQATTNYTMTTLSQWVVAWCNVVSNAAYAEGVVVHPMVYTYPSYASTYLDSTVTAYYLDMATVSPPQNPQTGAPSCSGPWGCNWTVWQYSWTNVVPGIPGVNGQTDADTYNGTYDAMIGQLCPRPKHPNIDSWCGNNQNGEMQLFALNSINNVETSYQTCPNCSWTSWSAFGGPTCFETPASVGYNADLRMQVFVRGADNNIWSTWQTNVNGGWSSWNNYGGPVYGDVSVGYQSNGAMQIFARSSTNTVITMYQTAPNSGWTAWSNLGGNCAADPVVGYNSDGRFQLFCQTSSNTLQSNFKTTTNTWFGWTDYGGSCYGKPAVASLENGVMQVFTRTSSNTVHTIYQTSPSGGWGSWSDMGGDCIASPAVGYNADGRVQLFTQTHTNSVSTDYKKTTSPGAAWSGWSSLGGSCYYDLTVGYNADGRVEIFCRDNSYNVQTLFQTTVASTSWSSWLNFGNNGPTVSITTQPANQTVNQGQNATFSVVAANALTYQWKFNAGNISGATGTSYTVVNAQPANAGTYNVLVANDAASVTSSNATLTVIQPPIIATQPASQTVPVSNSVTFSVTLSQGSAPLSYQWRYNGANISGATASSYTLNNLNWNSGGNYSVVITNAAGSVTSGNGVLTMEQAIFNYTNGFESYSIGVLDQNDSGGPNANLSNPWWGPAPPNLSVYTNVGSIAPHGGSKMVGATSGLGYCQEYINLPYRFDAQHTYYGNIQLDWWFYDPYGTGSGKTNYSDYMALAQYAPVSLTNDFTTTTFTAWNQRMSLGAANVPGYNSGVYQARVVGATGGVNTNGWFNTATARSVGWHHARIAVGNPTNNSGPVTMYIDNMTNSVLSYPNSGVNVGFNLIEVNCSMNGPNTGGYFDDMVFSASQ